MNWILFIVLIVLGLLALFIYRFLYQRQFIKLSMILYSQGDADGYLQELEKPMSKIFFATDLRKLMSIDAYMAKEDNDKLNDIFERVENGKLKPGDHFTVLQKEVPFYCRTNQNQKALDAFNKMKELRSKLKATEQRYDLALKECEYEIEIGVKHNGDYAEELVQKSKSIKETVPSGVYLYKAAQCYYFRKDQKMCKNCLEQAEVKLRQTPYSEKIKKIMETNNYAALEKSL